MGGWIDIQASQSMGRGHYKGRQQKNKANWKQIVSLGRIMRAIVQPRFRVTLELLQSKKPAKL